MDLKPAPQVPDAPTIAPGASASSGLSASAGERKRQAEEDLQGRGTQSPRRQGAKRNLGADGDKDLIGLLDEAGELLRDLEDEQHGETVWPADLLEEGITEELEFIRDMNAVERVGASPRALKARSRRWRGLPSVS